MMNRLWPRIAIKLQRRIEINLSSRQLCQNQRRLYELLLDRARLSDLLHNRAETIQGTRWWLVVHDDGFAVIMMLTVRERLALSAAGEPLFEGGSSNWSDEGNHCPLDFSF
jgi:hypothetical protein